MTATAQPATNVEASSDVEGQPARSRFTIALWRHLLFWTALCVLPLFLDSSYSQRILTTGVIAGIFVLGVNLKVGWAGLFSAGEAAWYGIGAYTTALLTVDAGWNPWLGVVAATAMGAITGYVIGAPILRLRHHYLALATLGANLIVVMVLTNWVDVTHGAGGVVGIPPLSVGSFEFDSYTRYTYLSIAVLAITMACCSLLYGSRLGRAWRASRDAETAAGLMGVDVPAVKRRAFAVAGLIAGLAGALFAHSVQYVSPEQFGPHLSILVLSMAVVGGLGRLYGPVLGAIGLTALPELLRSTEEWYLLCYGVGLYLLVVLLPVDGTGTGLMAGKVASMWAWARRPGSYRSLSTDQTERSVP